MEERGVASILTSLVIADLMANTTRYKTPIIQVLSAIGKGDMDNFANPHNLQLLPNTDLLL